MLSLDWTPASLPFRVKLIPDSDVILNRRALISKVAGNVLSAPSNWQTYPVTTASVGTGWPVPPVAAIALLRNNKCRHFFSLSGCRNHINTQDEQSGQTYSSHRRPPTDCDGWPCNNVTCSCEETGRRERKGKRRTTTSAPKRAIWLLPKCSKFPLKNLRRDCNAIVMARQEKC